MPSGARGQVDRSRHPRHRPPWWPEDEAWPPVDRRHRRRGGFGCLFGLLFAFLALVVLGSVVAVAGIVVSSFGWLATLVVLALLLVVAGGVFAALRRSALVLDDLLEATRRVEAGDYTVRVAVPTGGPRPVRQLVSGFDTMAERLESDEGQRRSLLADVSHELRTPLAVLQGNLEAMLDGVHPADDAHLGALVEETKVIARLLEDLRTVALSEAGTLALYREPTDVGIVAADVVTSFMAQADRAGVVLDVDVADDLPLLDVDPVRLREVLANLVSNALRSTPAGGSVRIVGSSAASEEIVELAVTDTGTGIPGELLPHVFDRFAKGDASRGSGLGLAIAKALVEAHGGTITADSSVGRGTTMTVRLPRSA
jgi:signal transduction histidine kinase